MQKHFLALALSLGSIHPAFADRIACPDPAAAVQVATCPSEEELKYTFMGYCSDNARLYAKDTDTCASYENYRKLKNVVLWESADGAFQAYVSCDLPMGELRKLKPLSMSVTRQGKLTRLACNYADGVTFTYRTKTECKVQGDGNCASEPDSCTANCD